MSESGRNKKRKRMEKERLLNCYQERGLGELSWGEGAKEALFVSSSSCQPDNYKKLSLDRHKCLASLNSYANNNNSKQRQQTSLRNRSRREPKEDQDIMDLICDSNLVKKNTHKSRVVRHEDPEEDKEALPDWEHLDTDQIRQQSKHFEQMFFAPPAKAQKEQPPHFQVSSVTP